MLRSLVIHEQALTSLGQGEVELLVDQGTEVLGDLDRVLGGHACGCSLDQRGGNCANGEQAGEDKAAHFGLVNVVFKRVYEVKKLR
jgi:hypothetical protein